MGFEAFFKLINTNLLICNSHLERYPRKSAARSKHTSPLICKQKSNTILYQVQTCTYNYKWFMVYLMIHIT